MREPDRKRAPRMCMVAARFNSRYVDRMVEAARATLLRHGVEATYIELIRVPGAFELPLACQRVAESRRFDAILAFGCLIEGETDHYLIWKRRKEQDGEARPARDVA